MKTVSRLYVLVLGFVLALLTPHVASAAFAPSAVGSAIDKAGQVQTEEVQRRGGRGWGGGRGFRGSAARGGRHYGLHRFGVPRYGLPRYAAPRYYGVRRGYWQRPVYYGAPVYYGVPRSCFRRGWVFNGYRHVWRRYRVC